MFNFGINRFKGKVTTELCQHKYVMECVPEPRNRIDPMAVPVKNMGTEITIGRMPKYLCNVVCGKKNNTKADESLLSVRSS